MAKAVKNEDESKKPKNLRRKQQTVRERSQAAQSKGPRRLRRTASKVKDPLKKASSFGRREYHVVPLPDNKAGKVLRKRVRLSPKFVREAWREIRLVKWPNRKETIALTLAVFIFAVVFAAIVGVLDFGLDKLFREVIIKK